MVGEINYHTIEAGDTVYLEDWTPKTVQSDGDTLYIMVDEEQPIVAYEKWVPDTVKVCPCCKREL